MNNIISIVGQAMSNLTGNFDTVSSVGGLFIPLLVLGIAAGAIYVLFMMSASIEKYRRFKKLFTSLSKVFGYAAYGSLTVVVVGVPCLAGYWAFTTAASNPEGTINILKPMGIIVGLFIGVTMLGYATKNRIWKRIFKFHNEEKLLKEVKENVKELLGVIE